jgi:hypothetical protein
MQVVLNCYNLQYYLHGLFLFCVVTVLLWNRRILACKIFYNFFFNDKNFLGGVEQQWNDFHHDDFHHDFHHSVCL